MTGPPGAKAHTGSGRSNPRRNALTGRQLEMVTAAAEKTLQAHAPDQQVSPWKIGKMVQRFTEVLGRSNLSFHEYLSHTADHPPVDAGLRTLCGILDPTGVKAVNAAMRHWNPGERRYGR